MSALYIQVDSPRCGLNTTQNIFNHDLCGVPGDLDLPRLVEQLARIHSCHRASCNTRSSSAFNVTFINRQSHAFIPSCCATPCRQNISVRGTDHWRIAQPSLKSGTIVPTAGKARMSIHDVRGMEKGQQRPRINAGRALLPLGHQHGKHGLGGTMVNVTTLAFQAWQALEQGTLRLQSGS